MNHLDKKPFLKSVPFMYITDCVITAYGVNSIFFLKLLCIPKHMFTLKTVVALRQLL